MVPSRLEDFNLSHILKSVMVRELSPSPVSDPRIDTGLKSGKIFWLMFAMS